MERNRIELWGRPVDQPELRTTPAGTAVLRFAIDCEADGADLRLDVVMAGEVAREAAAWIKAGQEVYVAGRLRPTGPAVRLGSAGRRSVEIVASEIKPVAR